MTNTIDRSDVNALANFSKPLPLPPEQHRVSVLQEEFCDTAITPMIWFRDQEGEEWNRLEHPCFSCIQEHAWNKRQLKFRYAHDGLELSFSTVSTQIVDGTLELVVEKLYVKSRDSLYVQEPLGTICCRATSLKIPHEILEHLKRAI